MVPSRLQSLCVAASLVAAAHSAQAVTPLGLTATALYAASGDCTGSTSGAPAIVTATPATIACVASQTCAVSNTLYPATVCSATDGTSAGDFIATDLPALFASSPYVVVEAYAAGTGCATPSNIATITAYLADGKCHKTGASASFKAVRKADGTAAVKKFAAADCTGTAETRIITAAQYTGNSCAAGNDGIVDTKIYGDGMTDVYLSSAATFVDDVKTCKMEASSTLTQLVTTVSATSCTSGTTCASGSAEPYTNTVCGTTADYADDVATVFASTPYIIVEKYTAGAKCAVTDLASITTYVADGKCHKTGTSTSFKAVRKADGTAAVKTFAAADCTGTAETRIITAAQYTGNSCAAGNDGIVDTKIYGDGTTDVYLSSAATFVDAAKTCTMVADSTLTRLVTTVEAAACTSDVACGSETAEPFTSKLCSTTADYATEIATVFGDTPYVIVEKYTAGAKCAVTDLEGITTYVADGKCHKTGAAASFVAKVNAAGLITITKYSDATCTAIDGEPFEVTADQAAGNSCTAGEDGIADTKIYSSGKIVYSVVGLYKGASCSDPAQFTISNEFTCSPASCSASGSNSVKTFCPESYFDWADVIFDAAKYLVVEVYTPETNCGVFEGATVYVADTDCHIAMVGGYTVTLDAGSATLVQYTDAACEVPDGNITTPVSPEELSENTCLDDKKFYAFNGPPPPPPPPSSTTKTPSSTTNTPSSTTKTPATPSSTTAAPSTPSSTTEAPTTTSTGSGTSDAASLFSTFSASLGLLAAAFGLLL